MGLIRRMGQELLLSWFMLQGAFVLPCDCPVMRLLVSRPGSPVYNDRD